MNPLPPNKKLGSIMNNDHTSILYSSSGDQITPDEYSHVVDSILSAGPGVLALRVGNPDSVFYDSHVTTAMDKYHLEVCLKTFTTDPGTGEKWLDEQYLRDHHGGLDRALKRLFEFGADPLALAVEAGKHRDIPVVASYRMNAEDQYDYTWMLTDFGRAHPECRIAMTPHEIGGLPEGCRQKQWTGALDPAKPQVYEHRMGIFREVAEKYDIAGIEFDFMRWNHMICDPLRNHPILTKMVAVTRAVLDEAARRKGRDRMLLGVRVPPSLHEKPEDADYPGMEHAGQNESCQDKGLDVAAWVANEYVDYVCPSLFWPQWPGKPNTVEFVELAKDTNVGVYPTLFPKPEWLTQPIETEEQVLRYKDEFCQTALRFYADEPDGLSTFNWASFGQPGMVVQPQLVGGKWGMGAKRVQHAMTARLASAQRIRQYLAERDVGATVGWRQSEDRGREGVAG